MNWVALKMLLGDRAKYLGLIFGVTFATHLMSQQVSIFMGIITRTGNAILDVRDAEVWVMERHVRFVDEAPPLPDRAVYRVRGVPGVEWAVRLYKGSAQVRREDGQTRNVYLTGVDDASLAGAPREMLHGRVEDLDRPDAVIIDSAGYEFLWQGEPVRLGREFQINERRAVLVGVCKAGSPFFSIPLLTTRYSNATRYVPAERNRMTYVLARPTDGEDAATVARRIEERTGWQARTRDEFFWMTVGYFLGSTGIPVNFGVTIVLGFLVGAAVTGQTLYLFTLENLRQFGALKAMGVSNVRIVAMVLLQSLLVGGIGFALGIGMTAIFFLATGNITHLAGLYMTGVAFTATGVAVLVIILLATYLSIRRVLVLEPAVVFRG